MRLCWPQPSQKRSSSAVRTSSYMRHAPPNASNVLDRSPNYYSHHPFAGTCSKHQADSQRDTICSRPPPPFKDGAIDRLSLLPADFCVVKRTGIMLYRPLSYIQVSKRFYLSSTNYLMLQLRTYRYRARHSSAVRSECLCALLTASNILWSTWALS